MPAPNKISAIINLLFFFFFSRKKITRNTFLTTLLNRRSNLVNYARLGTLTLSPLMRHSALLQFFPRGNKWSETGPICPDLG